MKLYTAVSLAACMALFMFASPLGAQLEDAVETIDMPIIAMPDNTLSLNVENMPVTWVLRLLAEIGGRNVIAGDDVTGSITINLHGVTFDEALDAVVNISGNSSYSVGNVTYITSPERKAEIAVGASDMVTQVFQLNHVEPEAFLETVNGFVSTGGKAMVSPNKTIIVFDSPANLSVIQQLVREMDVPPRQVLIDAHIVRVNHDDNMDVGVGFDTMPYTLFGLEGLAAGFAQYFANVTNETALGLFLGTVQTDFKVFLQALQEKADVDILAAPRLLALDGQPARIQVGDRLGFRITTTTETASLESIEFLEVGTVLELTPNITKTDLIEMEISPKVSSGFINAAGIPSESTTEVETSMLVKNNETIIIGGLLDASKTRRRSQIPLLGDIPVLGKLFGRNTWIDDRSEVVVFITPHIMGATAPPAMVEKIQATRDIWGEFGDEGLITKPDPDEDQKSRRKSGLRRHDPRKKGR